MNINNLNFICIFGELCVSSGQCSGTTNWE